MNKSDSSHERLVWLSDGHVSEWVLNALVDNEVALLPGEVVLHVDTCDHCTERLATMASTVFALGFELTRLAEYQAKQKTPFPRALFAVASFSRWVLRFFHGTSRAGPSSRCRMKS